MENLTIKCIECDWTYTIEDVTVETQDATVALLESKLATEHECPTA